MLVALGGLNGLVMQVGGVVVMTLAHGFMVPFKANDWFQV